MTSLSSRANVVDRINSDSRFSVEHHPVEGRTWRLTIHLQSFTNKQIPQGYLKAIKEMAGIFDPNQPRTAAVVWFNNQVTLAAAVKAMQELCDEST